MNFQGFLHCTLGLTVATVSLKTAPAIAQMTQQELDGNGVIAVASPYQNGEQHQLLIVEQLSNKRACWGEQKTTTAITLINPLLSEFDFSGICGRATDSNGFSVRMGGQDLNWRYALQMVEKDNNLLLMARNTTQKKSNPDMVVGRVGGTTTDFAKIVLEPGWRITRRIADGKLTGHFYLTNDRSLEQMVAAMKAPNATSATTAVDSNVLTNSVILTPPISTPISAPPTVPDIDPKTGFPTTTTVPAIVPPAPPMR